MSGILIPEVNHPNYMPIFLTIAVLIVMAVILLAINVNSYPMVVEMSRGSDISYRTLFPYSFLFSILSLCTMLYVRPGDSKPLMKRSALEHFDVED